MSKSIDALSVAKWFLDKNPSLRYGYNDENTKLNKLLYFSELMYSSLYGERMITEDFEKWDNGPVIREIYKGYRYKSLAKLDRYDTNIIDEKINKVIKIINLIYSNKTARELSKETHNHSIWQEAMKNEKINFNNIADKEKKLMCSLFNAYKDLDFNDIGIEKVNGNIYYYFKSNLNITDDILLELDEINEQNEPMFIELIDDELVFS